tara:strand:- start:247 stop:1347 length:1101 start_codon:yes stop_codon:yes gene_type:complete
MLHERVLKNVNGLNINYYFSTVNKESKKKKTVLLLHGFPELGFSFRYLIKILSANGYFCIAPDQRGYGKTSFINEEEQKLSKFSVLNLVEDINSFLKKINIYKVDLIGHDFGAYVSCYLALLYPNLINSIIIMSMPFSGPPNKFNSSSDIINLNKNLGKLSPRRKHYQKYFSSSLAADNILNCKQGLFDFLRGYFYFKSHNYKENKPHKLKNYSAAEFSRLPEYYIMLKKLGMAETIQNFMPNRDSLIECQKWLPDNDLKKYSRAFRKGGFKYPLYWYRVMISLREKKRLLKKKLPDNLKIPSLFIAGESDWGMFQKPGDLEAMENNFLKNFYGIKIIKNAGHWVQQEKPSETAKFILEFYRKINN